MDDHFEDKFREIFVDGDFESNPKDNKPPLTVVEQALGESMLDGPFIEELKGKSDEN
ncbi:hypothetical protein [Sessilibacter corallicola]|uniref:hypothetical protein n=1 Tax=Sessilibacter corallicola TaxID=2904075 RepID=UPI001E4AAB38|nr:hypothetical protein [Sessilibacter corallicola]MCE2029268.1 hypothetical protein [Sessilibacter corallicola]